MLTNDKNPTDKHPEYKELGGVQIEGHAVAKTSMICRAQRSGSSVIFRGRLGPGTNFGQIRLSMLFTGAVPGRAKGSLQLLSQPVGHAAVNPNGEFRGVIERAEFKLGACLFAGTDKLSSAIAAPVPIK